MRYVLHGGTVVSRRDGQKHRIGVQTLARLYGLNLRHSHVVEFKEPFFEMNGDIHLHPRQDGNYTLPIYIHPIPTRETNMNEKQENKFFIIWCKESTSVSGLKYMSREHASKEAFALANLNPGQSYYVLEAVDGYVNNTATKIIF